MSIPAWMRRGRKVGATASAMGSSTEPAIAPPLPLVATRVSTSPEGPVGRAVSFPPDGHPGDSWQSDLIVWGLPVFGDPVDGLLRELHSLTADFGLSGSPLLATLDTHGPMSLSAQQQTDLAAGLQALIDAHPRLLRPDGGVFTATEPAHWWTKQARHDKPTAAPSKADG